MKNRASDYLGLIFALTFTFGLIRCSDDSVRSLGKTSTNSGGTQSDGTVLDQGSSTQLTATGTPPNDANSFDKTGNGLANSSTLIGTDSGTPPPPCVLGYPVVSNNPRSNVIFNYFFFQYSP